MSYNSNDNYQRFLDFYGNNKVASCHGKSKEGDLYMCPYPSIGGPYDGSKPLASTSDCGTGNNIGRWAQCPVTQSGGCGGMTYSANGILSDKKGNCQKGAGIPGFYSDLPSGSIAKRAIYNVGDSNTAPNLLLAPTKRHFVKRTFNCQQPTWDKKCM